MVEVIIGVLVGLKTNFVYDILKSYLKEKNDRKSLDDNSGRTDRDRDLPDGEADDEGEEA